MRALRFGIMTLQPTPYRALAERWRRVEELGFDSLWVADSLSLPRPIAYEAWSTCAALAATTSRVRVGVLVANIALRHPALLAQAAMSVDHVSGGRLDLGLGAGDPLDNEVLGISPWSPGERVARLGESLAILDALLREGTVDHAGPQYRARASLALPAQRPRPPFYVAAQAPRTFDLVARYADAWNTLGGQPQGQAAPVPLDHAIAVTARQVGLLEERCAAIGRDPNAVRRSFLAFRARPSPFSSVEAFHEIVGRYRELGIDEFILYWPYRRSLEDESDELGVLERVAAEEIPKLRSAPVASTS